MLHQSNWLAENKAITLLFISSMILYNSSGAVWLLCLLQIIFLLLLKINCFTFGCLCVSLFFVCFIAIFSHWRPTITFIPTHRNYCTLNMHSHHLIAYIYQRRFSTDDCYFLFYLINISKCKTTKKMIFFFFLIFFFSLCICQNTKIKIVNFKKDNVNV